MLFGNWSLFALSCIGSVFGPVGFFSFSHKEGTAQNDWEQTSSYRVTLNPSRGPEDIPHT